MFYLPAILAGLVVLLGAYFAEQQNKSISWHEQRARISAELDGVRAKFENHVESNIQLVKGLVAAIATEPDMDQRRFSDLSGRILAGSNEIRNVTAAPDLVISMVYPIYGNDKVIGLDYREVESQLSGILRARDSKTMVFEGPINLVQGDLGFVVRFPVFLERPMQEDRFWGVVSAVFDTQKLYKVSGIMGNASLRIMLSGMNGTPRDTKHIFGDQRIAGLDPVSTKIILPYGTFTLSAVPADGWNDTPDNLWLIRALSALAFLVITVPMVIVGWLSGERSKNIAKLNESRENFKRLSDRLELALSTSQIGVWEFDATNEELFWDDRMRELYGLKENRPPVYEDWVNRLHPDDLEQAKQDFSLALVERKVYHSQFRIIRDDGSIRVIRTIGSTRETDDGSVRIVGVNWDITEDVEKNQQLEFAKNLSELKNAELEETKNRIEHNALHDSLTGLPNRRYLDEVLSGKHTDIFGDVNDYGLLHIDLDRFKQINDTLGHAAGDHTLIHTAKILKNNVRETDFVARVGGDEFIILCTSKMNRERLKKLAARLNRELSRPITINQRECRFGVSIGIAGHESVNDDPEKLLINADIALYEAKNQGRNTFRFYTEELHLAAINTKKVADEILTAIEQRQFVVHYQGQFDASTLRICGVEALARWRHPERGLLAPPEFIEIAEELNVMAQIDASVLEQALAQMQRWKGEGIDVPSVSVNVSARRLNDARLIQGLKALNIEPGVLTFELLETILLDETSDQVAWNIDQLKEMGIDIELDDFGTGFASIVSLMKLQPRRLKIDRQLVFPVTRNEAQQDLLLSIINIGSALGIGSVAEGIETLEHAKIMRDLGCEVLQGFGLARPMSGQDFSAFAQKLNRSPLRVA